MVGLFFFFVKQKPAYEMRISDWSSDVCSSDLAMFLAQRSLIYPAAAIAPRLADQALPALRAIETEPEPGLRLTHWYHPPAGEREPLIVFFLLGRASWRERVCRDV